MATGSGDLASHEVQRGLALVSEGLDLLCAASGLCLSDDETREAAAVVTALSARCRAAYLHLLRLAAERDEPGTAGQAVGAAGPETSAWLAERTRMSVGRVRADLREARALDPVGGDLRGVGAQLAAGAITSEHASIAAGALGGLPSAVLRARRDDVDAVLCDHATQFATPITRRLARHLLDTVCPDRAEQLDARAHQRREVHLSTDATGMGVLRGQLDAPTAAHLKAVLDQLAAPHRGPVESDAGTALTIKDQRTPAQRRHDALAEMTRLAAGNLAAGTRAGEPPRVVVHASPEQVAAAAARARPSTAVAPGAFTPAGPATCEQTGPLTPATLALLACDAVVDRVVLGAGGRVLEMTSLGRLFTAAQRRALAARDGGCAFPGCDRPPSWCDAHHVVFWSDGGPTTVDNGVLLCGPHHTLVHLGDWVATVHDGVPWFTPPRHLDPLRRSVRNEVHRAVARTRRVAQQLHLDVGPVVGTDPGG